MLKIEEIRDLSTEELEVTLRDLRAESFKLSNEFKHAEKNAKTHLIRETKKSIARVCTVMNEKQLANQ